MKVSNAAEIMHLTQLQLEVFVPCAPSLSDVRVVFLNQPNVIDSNLIIVLKNKLVNFVSVNFVLDTFFLLSYNFVQNPGQNMTIPVP